MRWLLALCGVAAAAGGFGCALVARGAGGQGAAVTIRPPIGITRPIVTRPLPIITVPLPPPTVTAPPGEVRSGPILFVSTRDGADEIYKMEAPGADQTRLTDELSDVGDPTLSPSGDLTYSGEVNGHREIVERNATGALTLLTHDGRRAREPRWLPGGDLLYVSNRTGTDHVWRLDPASGLTTDLTAALPGASVDPAPSPDGTKVAFASGRGSALDIDVLDLATGAVTQLTHDGAANGHPAWSPDGSRIAFDRAGAGGSDIWLMNADGSDPHPLANTGADEFGPSYAPGRSTGPAPLVWVSNATGDYEIWSGADDGSGAHDISRSPGGEDLSPQWVPAPIALELLVTVAVPGIVPDVPVRQFRCTVTSKHGSHVIVGTAHDDVICGTPKADVIRGLGGDDVIIPGGGSDTVFGGAGDDTVYAHDKHTDTIDGGAGTNTFYVDAEDVSTHGLAVVP